MRNNTMLTDLYQLTMMQGLFLAGKDKQEAVFDRFYRTNPCNGGYSIIAGLEHVIEYIKNIQFTDEDIEYLKTLNLFCEEFLAYLKEFRFTGDIWAIPEGTVVFPGEPLLRVHARKNEALFIETALSMFLNHESLIATKASRVRWAAKDDFLMEFGLRRAQGADAALYGARAAVIGGFDATSNVLAGKLFGIPVVGTMAHSWVMSFDDELTAFREYAKRYPDNAILLVDTYDTIGSGVPNAIKVFTEMRSAGLTLQRYGIRLDSGDLAYLSKAAREMLDEAGFADASIAASNDLDEHLIAELKLQEAKINSWGVGTKLITSEGCSALGGVYKLAAEVGAVTVPKMKFSNNVEKITNPGIKKVFRIYDKKSGKIRADIITLADEEISTNEDLALMDPTHSWKRMTLCRGTFTVQELLVPIFRNGQCVYDQPQLSVIQNYAKEQLQTLWDEYRRLVNPHIMKIDLSDKLYDLKKELIYRTTHKPKTL
ncbi:nicotinate phosphoribosyltransferase [Anaerospora hongkongensis]|uniref:Nicotinate phosphoribosyltransferase n=1 Tax=Anaerospora hongkongensis TaxID=244830 RepID=A0A4R1Q1T9_9FIRM|nr:nicotinate phosphoribosyltransferase [Anaerospora hongkongensis]TCL37598.1 nicotinate phosphoribosyltransferase [Anaerospora hongkongensis]